MTRAIRVLLVGAGHMGSSHGRAFDRIQGFELVGIVTRGRSGALLAAELSGVRHFQSLELAIGQTKPDAVAIASFTDTHVEFANMALDAGCHVFIEKPLAPTMREAEALVAKAADESLTLVVGYILRHHPSWQQFIERAQTLGKPLVMRMNLNQQSYGPEWQTHKSILKTTSPIVDCGVHYVDVMSQMTQSVATHVHAIGARLVSGLPEQSYNYGQLQVTFADGSIGWYEAGWGPMMSETAFFVKDVIGPLGAVSIESRLEDSDESSSSDVAVHTQTNCIRHHFAEVDEQGMQARSDELIETSGEPAHDDLCQREQEWFLRAIAGTVNVKSHLQDVLQSQRIVLAADESIRTGKVVAIESAD